MKIITKLIKQIKDSYEKAYLIEYKNLNKAYGLDSKETPYRLKIKINTFWGLKTKYKHIIRTIPSELNRKNYEKMWKQYIENKELL